MPRSQLDFVESLCRLSGALQKKPTVLAPWQPDNPDGHCHYVTSTILQRYVVMPAS